MNNLNLISDRTYRIIAIVSLLCLITVQYKLIYNTFELKDNQYYLKEREVINTNYSALIRNDKLYPGSQKIIDSYIIKNIFQLDSLFANDYDAYEHNVSALWESMMTELKSKQNMDTIFPEIVKEFNLNDDLKYGLYIEHLSISFDGINYVPVFMPNIKGIIPSHKNGELIAGTLTRIDKQNKVTSYTVSAQTKNSYQITFSLYVDQDNRFLMIIKAMLPMFLLSLFSIVLVIGIYYITYRNWMRQKKLTAMTSDFINSISHEFNTPIATILVTNQSLANSIESNDIDSSLRLITVIKRQSIRLKNLINQSLMISQLSSINLDKKLYYLPTVLLEILEDYSFKLESSVTIIPNFENDIKEIELNKFLLTTMIYNLLDNGIKYNNSLTKKIEVNLYSKDSHIFLEFCDNGVGIDVETLKHVFKKFFRGKQRVAEGGLGLGLFYVQQVVNLHGWNLDVVSGVDKGSKFIIKINVKK